MAVPVRLVLRLLVAFVGISSPVRAEQPPPVQAGQTVVSVDFSVEGRPEVSPAIIGLSDVRVGQPLRQQDWRATIARLDSLGRYEDIHVLTTPVPGGVAVTFRLVPRHPITQLAVRGDTGISSATRLEVLLRQRYGGVPTGVRLAAVAAAAEQLLHNEGYLDAEVDASTELLHDPEGAVLVLDVRAGTRAIISRIDVRGASPLSPEEIITRTSTREGQPFRRRVIESALTGLETDLRERGYYEAQVNLLPPSRTLVGVDLVIALDTGPLVEVRVTPANVLPGNTDDLIPVSRLGSADQDLLEDARARVERALRAQGYWKASAPFTRQFDSSAGRLVITFTVTRGPRYYVDRVELPPTLALSPATLRTLIGIQSGDLFDQDRFVGGLTLAVDAYRRNGYYRVESKPSYEEVSAGTETSRALVVLHPNITEGPRGVLTGTAFTFGTAPQVAESDLRAVLRSKPGQPYVAFDAVRDESSLRSLYLDRGFRTAQVVVRPVIAADGREVALAVQINEGRQVRIGQISIVGNDRVSEQLIREELGLSVGLPAGVTLLNDAQARLSEMGVFRQVALSSIDQFAEADTHLIVNVVESPARMVAVGGGLEGGTCTSQYVDGGNREPSRVCPARVFRNQPEEPWRPQSCHQFLLAGEPEAGPVRA